MADTLNNTLYKLAHRDGIGPVHCNGREVLRRIFLTVRDRQWREVAPTHWESAIDEARRTATVTARHISDDVAFEWEGKLHVNNDLTELSFAVTGKALRDMEVCRLGLVVLHPLESMIGSRIAAVGPQAGHRLIVSDIISPQPIVNGIPVAMTEPFSKLFIERSDFGKLEIRFEGDLFELEDQRNWGDTSFKTYCTPLRLGFPRTVKAGESIVQRIEVSFLPTLGSENTHAVPFPGIRTNSLSNGQPYRFRPNRKDQPATTSKVFPRIGRDGSAASGPLRSETEHPAWHHIHLQVQGDEGVALLRSMLESPAVARIEIGVEAADEKTPIDDVFALVSTYHERISRILLYGPSASRPSATVIQRWRQRIDSIGAQVSIPLLAATRGYFVEFNRGVALDASATGIAFPLTATVHSDDAVTITDNVSAIHDMVETARHLTGLTDIVIAPLALYYPALTTKSNFLRDLIRPWLAASLIYAALARVTSVTLAEDVFEAVASNDTDTLAFISGLVECAGYEVALLDLALSPGLHAAAFRSATQEASRILAANLAPHPTMLSLAESGLRAKTARNAVTGAAVPVNDEELEIPGFGVTWIELLQPVELP
jgi:hypothetical protein